MNDNLLEDVEELQVLSLLGRLRELIVYSNPFCQNVNIYKCISFSTTNNLQTAVVYSCSENDIQKVKNEREKAENPYKMTLNELLGTNKTVSQYFLSIIDSD